MFTIIKKVTHVIRKIYSTLLSPHCFLCGQIAQTGSLCPGCLMDLPILPNHCQQCAEFIPTHQGSTCFHCLKRPPPFDRFFTLFPYTFPISTLIVRLKFAENLIAGKILSDLLYRSIKTHWYPHQPLPAVLIPMPLHPQRLATRGFNQALEIAKPLARALSINLLINHHFRIKNTLPQTHLSAKAREQNMKRAFKVTADLSGLHIAILDDVATTTHTLRAFAEVLKQQGAKRIDVWVCARRSLTS